MDNKEVSMLELLIESHAGLERQGPGSADTTLKALSFLDGINEIKRVADLGCGSGGQTMVLARHIKGKIIGVDLFQEFIDVFNNNAERLNLQDRVIGTVGSMEKLAFEKEEFDLIWSEGAIDNIGFEKGLAHWRDFLKKGGYVSVTCPSWLTDEHPADVAKFWADAGSRLDNVWHNIETMNKCGYRFVAAFALPEGNWTENYFVPREAAEQALLEKYPDSEALKDYIKGIRYEADLFSKHKTHYGYVFYIGKKL